MAEITFIQADGTRQTFEIAEGLSVMEGAVSNGVEGIEAECGGACACATCHVKISTEWLGIVGGPEELEDDMLEAAQDRDERSRLACQIKVTAALNGLTVEIPG